MLKAFWYQNFCRGALPPPPLGHDQTKIPRADRVKDTASLRKGY